MSVNEFQVEHAIAEYLARLDQDHPHYSLLRDAYPIYIRFLHKHKIPVRDQESLAHNLAPSLDLATAMVATVLGSIKAYVPEDQFEEMFEQTISSFRAMLINRLDNLHSDDTVRAGQMPTHKGH